MNIPRFVFPSPGEHLGGFYLLTVVNNVALDICLLVGLDYLVSVALVCTWEHDF